VKTRRVGEQKMRRAKGSGTTAWIRKKHRGKMYKCIGGEETQKRAPSSYSGEKIRRQEQGEKDAKRTEGKWKTNPCSISREVKTSF